MGLHHFHRPRCLDCCQPHLPDSLQICEDGWLIFVLLYICLGFIFPSRPVQGEAQTSLEDDRAVKTGLLVFTVGLVAGTVIILVSILITEISD